ncbi:hypothetical protein HBH70_108900 [Parastagonospora nodorum]|nr:hypothetical protein HBI09_112670 [Parastagonospora nodorum]KAH4044584.1 hypothetical protein HBH49_216470 [Parastagonospora nodorum]KAH4072400.1 hypothetical protein HBH50_059130 [Parastagonospora nodorum]KAH4088932.1 hypothetical protein HBH48_120790 [Parastagonospora nodorum]KAH4204756.1 hypothetical protein HBI95_148870 [Parastagonospora nodorum]
MATKPPYVFKIDEIREHPDIRPSCTTSGHWIPSTSTGYNYRSGGGISNTWWYNQTDRIRQVPVQSLPQPLNHFKTFSVFYSGGRGFWVLQGDGTTPDPSEAWMPLRFEPVADGSSYLTPAGACDTLQCQRPDQLWAHKLLPNIYHGPYTQNPNYGGLRGDLPIFLALVALSMDPANLPTWLPWMFQGSQWHPHTLDHGWQHKRGVVVSVYTCPVTWAGGSTTKDLTNLEDGAYGKYFN